MNRDFKGVWVPKEIYLSKDLSWSEKILLIEIGSLEGEEGCWASNQYLAEFLGIKEGTLANLLTRLKDAGFLKVEGYGKSRRLFTVLSLGNETSGGKFHEKMKLVSRKNETPIYRINNTENNKADKAANETGYHLYRKYYKTYPLHLFNEEQLRAVTEDLDVFEQMLEIWVGRQYKEQNIRGMLSLFEKLKDERKPKEVVDLFCDKCRTNSGWLEAGEGWIRCSH